MKEIFIHRVIMVIWFLTLPLLRQISNDEVFYRILEWITFLYLIPLMFTLFVLLPLSALSILLNMKDCEELIGFNRINIFFILLVLMLEAIYFLIN